MKKTLSLLLALLMLTGLVSCGPSLIATTQTQTQTATEGGQTPEQTQTSPDANAPLTIPQGNCAGYARVDISPTLFPVAMNSSDKAKRVEHPLYASIVAISDGDEVAMMIHLDLKRVSDGIRSTTVKIIEEETGVPADHIMMTATHTHTAPELNYVGDDPIVTKWYMNVYQTRIRQAARAAYADLAPAEMYGGHADTTGFAFARRYICADGSFDGIHMAYPTGSKRVRHETDADPDLQALHFKRSGGKKDIVMVNWQAHVAHAASDFPAAVTSDFVHYLRQGVEKELGAHFAYYNGACGNLNLSTSFSALRAAEVNSFSGSIWEKVGKALVGKVKDAIAAEQKMEMGEIKVSLTDVDAKVRKDDPARIAQAKEYTSASAANKPAIQEKYKFQSKYEASSIVTRSNIKAETEKLPLQVIIFGDFAIAGASYEMFDVSGMEVKSASPYKMTFMCGCTNGSNGYIPSRACYQNGGYETHCCRYEIGTAEQCVAKLLEMLKTSAA